MNKLIHETSPYLLQHAHNPVEWYAWGPEALSKAKAEQKLILVSIGYSTCHWCHVMERESFEHHDTAAVMNEHFVCIKVDREERPDIDAIYMEACQVLTGGGGWPLNCFLTPDARPFYAGTYFPPRPAYNRPSWIQLLNHLATAWRERPDEVIEQAVKVVGYIQKADKPMVLPSAVQVETEGVPSAIARVGEAYLALSERFDTANGGFGTAPKFPGSMSIAFLLQFHYFSGFQEALNHAFLSLDKMCMGGIYDHLGGGFSRYATDNEWLIPHFEKMLYDNALLVSTLSDAYKILGKKEMDTPENRERRALYRETMEDTLEWLKREMTHAEGGFYAAQDADSEGVEGKFFVWTLQEVQQILKQAGFTPEQTDQVCLFYDITAHGNWEEQNIVHRNTGYANFSNKNNIDTAAFIATIRSACTALFNARDQRVYPGLDDKILLGWNALMLSALTDAYTALQEPLYREMALRSKEFLLKSFFPDYPNSEKWPENGHHTWKNGTARITAFLEDYAWLIAALTDMYETLGDREALRAAQELTDWTISAFYDTEDGLFFFTSASQTDIILRKKELYDNATPSSNSTMARNLQRLGILCNQPAWTAMSVRMVEALVPSVLKFPNAFGRWAEALLNQDLGIREVAITGAQSLGLAAQLQAEFLPNLVIGTDTDGQSGLALLEGKYEEDASLIYICRNFACQRPVETVEEALESLGAG